jgi:hypothetical protein
MSKVTKLHPDRSPDSDLFEETLGEIAVEEGYKLPETEAELDIYDRRLSSENSQRHSRFSSIHEALADAEKTQEVRYRKRKPEATEGSYPLAARNGDDIDTETLDMMDAAADEGDND